MKNKGYYVMHILSLLAGICFIFCSFNDLNKLYIEFNENKSFVELTGVCSNRKYSKTVYEDDVKVKYYSCTIQYNIEDFIFEFETESTSINVGDSVKILVNPNDFYDVKIMPNYASEIVPVAICFVCGIFLIGFSVFIIRVKNKEDNITFDENIGTSILEENREKNVVSEKHMYHNKQEVTLYRDQTSNVMTVLYGGYEFDVYKEHGFEELMNFEDRELTGIFKDIFDEWNEIIFENEEKIKNMIIEQKADFLFKRYTEYHSSESEKGNVLSFEQYKKVIKEKMYFFPGPLSLDDDYKINEFGVALHIKEPNFLNGKAGYTTHDYDLSFNNKFEILYMTYNSSGLFEEE